jgi:hypothetical protein
LLEASRPTQRIRTRPSFGQTPIVDRTAGPAEAGEKNWQLVADGMQ